MTSDEEQIAALKILLGRIRTNSDGRLTMRTGDEEEFVPRSVREARAQLEASRHGLNGGSSHAAATPPYDVLEGLDEDDLREVEMAGATPPEAPMDASGEHVRATGIPGEAMATGLASSPPLELDVFDPFEDEEPYETEHPLDAAPEPSHAPAPAASQVIATRHPPAPRSDPHHTSSLDLDDEDDEVMDAEDDLLDAEDDDQLDEGDPLVDLEEPERPTRTRDILAQTAQNPLPAAMFEIAAALDDGVLDDGMLDDGVLDDGGHEGDAARADSPVEETPPSSSRRAVDFDEPADAALESEPPPESGEMAGPRQPAVDAMRAFDLDGPTPTAAEGAHVAIEAAALLAAPEAVRASAPPRRPAFVGQRPLTARSFLEVLDAALAFGEPDL